MELITKVEYDKAPFKISHLSKSLLLGSCFAENIGCLMRENKFDCDVNPFGILYNPLSVSKALDDIIACKYYGPDDLFFHQECYHSYMHHGSFSATNQEMVLDTINTRLSKASQRLAQTEVLIITFGTAWVYYLQSTREVVSNCHKMPAKTFVREKLTVNDIVETYSSLIAKLQQCSPNLRLLFTVSPIRHVKDGLHENQLSKATLLLAVDELTRRFPEQVSYFPAYEIVMDELRDYRFYADDMAHPSALAIQYIWERFCELYFSADTLQLMKECSNLARALAHRPLKPDSTEYKRFLGQIVLKIEQLNEKYPYLDLKKELEQCYIQLNQ